MRGHLSTIYEKISILHKYFINSEHYICVEDACCQIKEDLYKSISVQNTVTK